MNPVIKSLLSHRSIRSYREKPVSEEDLTRIIKAVQAAPNWVNVQLVSVIAIKNPERKKRLAALCGNQQHIAAAPLFLVFCADYYRTWLACRAKGQSLDAVLEDMDTVIVGAHEAGIAVGTAVAAAESLGLGTVVIGDVRQNPFEVISELGLPPYVFPVLGLCVGYAAEEPGLKPRLPMRAMFFEERYDTHLEDALKHYDALYADYLATRPFHNRVGTWTELVRDFYSTPYHYEHTEEMLHRQKFLGRAGSAQGGTSLPQEGEEEEEGAP